MTGPKLITTAFAPANRVLTLVLLAIALALAAVGWFVVGIDDNLPGIALVTLGGASLAGALLHPIRTSADYRRAAIRALGLFGALVVLAFAAEALGAMLRPAGGEEGALGAAGIYIFVIASFIGFPAIIVATAGYVIAAIVERRRSRDE